MKGTQRSYFQKIKKNSIWPSKVDWTLKKFSRMNLKEKIRNNICSWRRRIKVFERQRQAMIFIYLLALGILHLFFLDGETQKRKMASSKTFICRTLAHFRFCMLVRTCTCIHVYICFSTWERSNYVQSFADKIA